MHINLMSVSSTLKSVNQHGLEGSGTCHDKNCVLVNKK